MPSSMRDGDYYNDNDTGVIEDVSDWEIQDISKTFWYKHKRRRTMMINKA